MRWSSGWSLAGRQADGTTASPPRASTCVMAPTWRGLGLQQQEQHFRLTPLKKNSSDAEVVKQNVTKQLKKVSQNEFLKCFGQLYERWGKCFVTEGEYFKEK